MRFFCFERFRYTLPFGKLFYQPREQFLCLLVYVGKVIVQLATYQQFGIEYLQANGVLYQVMAMLFNDINFQESRWGKNSVVDEIKYYLDINYAEKIKLQDVAKSFGIHPNYLTRIFHEKYGVSPKQYILDLKLKKARRLLTTTELSVSVIASSLGFDDQLAFSKIFKKEFSTSPSEFRKQSRISSSSPHN